VSLPTDADSRLASLESEVRGVRGELAALRQLLERPADARSPQ
jgi:hypothetical protein